MFTAGDGLQTVDVLHDPDQAYLIRLKGTLPVMFWRWCTSPWATALMTAAWTRLVWAPF